MGEEISLRFSDVEAKHLFEICDANKNNKLEHAETSIFSQVVENYSTKVQVNEPSSFGGRIQYYSIKTSTVIQGVEIDPAKVSLVKEYEVNGSKRYVLIFKNGTTIDFETQNEKNKAQITNKEGNIFHLNNLKDGNGLYITGTKKDDLFIIGNSKVKEINLYNGNDAVYMNNCIDSEKAIIKNVEKKSVSK